jgi:hypothetical protein
MSLRKKLLPEVVDPNEQRKEAARSFFRDFDQAEADRDHWREQAENWKKLAERYWYSLKDNEATKNFYRNKYEIYCRRNGELSARIVQLEQELDDQLVRRRADVENLRGLVEAAQVEAEQLPQPPSVTEYEAVVVNGNGTQHAPEPTMDEVQQMAQQLATSC